MNWYDALEWQLECTQFLKNYASRFPRHAPSVDAGAFKMSVDGWLITSYRADTLYVDDDMTSLVLEATKSLLSSDVPVLLPEGDLLCRMGFCVFGKEIWTKNDLFPPISGLMWNFSWGQLTEEEGKALLYDQSEPRRPHDSLVVTSLHLNHHFEDESLDEITQSTIVPWGLSGFTIEGEGSSRYFKPIEPPTDFAQRKIDLGHTLQSLFVSVNSLGSRRIATSGQESPPRPTRKRARKWKEGDTYITVIKLRKSSGRKKDEQDKVDWSHRWIVRGHWRKQWYPKLKTHIPVYIHEFVKGPEDKPLVVSERRVFNWVR